MNNTEVNLLSIKCYKHEYFVILIYYAFIVRTTAMMSQKEH